MDHGIAFGSTNNLSFRITGLRHKCCLRTDSTRAVTG